MKTNICIAIISILSFLVGISIGLYNLPATIITIILFACAVLYTSANCILDDMNDSLNKDNK